MDPLEVIKQSWAGDCIFDEDKLDQESLKIPSLHAKYQDYCCLLYTSDAADEE